MSEELKPIRMDGKYQTRNGLAVRILCVDAKAKTHPVVALITKDDGYEDLQSFTQYGKLCDGETTKFDLVEVDEQVRYVNVYPEATGIVCDYLPEALEGAKPKRTGTLKITHINGKLTSVEIVE